MPHVDSIGKIVTSYFACVTRVPFTYNGKTFEPKPLRVSAKIDRGYICHAKCGACCSRFSLDYIPGEPTPEGTHLQVREVMFNGRVIKVLSDMQHDHQSHHCRNLDMQSGLCRIHGEHPFSCDFELIRFLRSSAADKPNTLTQKLYGRAHAMLRIDGERGAMCEILPIALDHSKEVVRKLQRLEAWCRHFKFKEKDTVLPDVIDWVANWGKREGDSRTFT